MRKLLLGLENQSTKASFSYSVVVADNDPAQSAKTLVADFATSSRIRITYCCEPKPNIAMARNKALANAEADYIAFTDDDEVPVEDWLCRLLEACLAYQVDGVLGPVMPAFENAPPEWVIKGKFFDRPTHETGYQVKWEEARTGNVLFKKNILEPSELPFRVEFDTAGEDVDFFRRMMHKGRNFVWCNEAVVHELVPSSRCNRSYLLRRAMLRGSNFPKHPTDKAKNVARSLIAVPCYALALPLFALLGQHLFLKYLIKFLDHASRLLAFLGLRLVSERQT